MDSNKHRKEIVFLLIVAAVLVSVFLVNAQNSGSDDIIPQIKEQVMILGCQVFNILFYISTGLAAIFIVFSGIKYMTSESAEDRFEARGRVTYAVIGLALVILACPIVEFFIQDTKMKWGERPDCCPIFSFGSGGGTGGGTSPGPTLCCTSPNDPQPCSLCPDCNDPRCSEQNCIDCGYQPVSPTDCTDDGGTCVEATACTNGNCEQRDECSSPTDCCCIPQVTPPEPTDCDDMDGICDDSCDPDFDEKCVTGTEQCVEEGYACCCVCPTDCDDLNGYCDDSCDPDFDEVCRRGTEQCEVEESDCCCVESSMVASISNFRQEEVVT